MTIIQTQFCLLSSILSNIFHVCYWATIQWFLLFCCMTTVRQLSSPASDRYITVTTKS